MSWEYFGEPQIVILQNNPTGKNVLDFRNYVALDLVEGIRKSYIDSIPRLMTALIKSSKKEVTSYDLLNSATNRIKLRNVVELGIDSAKKIPAPVKKILKDKMFYLSSKKKK